MRTNAYRIGAHGSAYYIRKRNQKDKAFIDSKKMTTDRSTVTNA